MAPIQSTQSYSLHSSSSMVRPFACSCRGALSNDWEWFLPITRRGHFFQDSFFENARSHFDTAVRDVLRRWGDTNMLADGFRDTAHSFGLYRQLRSRNLKDENQAITVSSDDRSFKIVLDVHDFMDGDIKVKVIGEKEVLVEGYIENKKEEECSISSQRFSRRFLIPDNTDVEGISSVMSSDGILTITASRKNIAGTESGTRVILHKEESSDNVTQTAKTTTQAAHERVGDTANCTETQATINREKCCGNLYKNLIFEKKIDEKAYQHEETRIPIQNYSTQQVEDTKSNNTSYSGQKLTESTEEEKCNTCVSNQSSKKQISENKAISSEMGISTEKNNLSHDIPIFVDLSSLPITRRGLFFNDSIFENSRSDFLSAIREVLLKWGEGSSLMDDLTCYRNLRARDLREENQAVKVKEDESNHKFVLDVRDFMNGGEVNVKAINDREMVVEGHIERQEGGAKSVKRFFKRFTVPSDIRFDSVSSVMSSDGVLTITAPKKIQAVVTPTRTEEIQETSTERTLKSDVNSVKVLLDTEQEICKSSSKIQNSAASSGVFHETSTKQGNSTKEYIIPVSLEGTSKEVKLESTSHVTRQSDDNEKSAEKVLAENSDSSAAHHVSSFEKKTESDSEQNLLKIKVIQSNEAAKSCLEDHKNEMLSCSSLCKILPLTTKGSFSTDPFFEDSRRNFETAVREVLLKFRENSHSDYLNAYREMRQRNLTMENQAYNVHEDEQRHKVVVDARDFMDGDITVSLIGEKELVIEGRTENKKDASSSSLKFCLRVLLPESVDVSAITSAISSDGVLTVESLKTNTSSGLRDVKKTSSAAHSKQESHDDSGHKWEEKSVKESSEQPNGCSSRTLCASYGSRQEYSIAHAF